MLILMLLLNACGSDRAGSENNSSSGVLGVVDNDSDGDGISDSDEREIYNTNPDKNDTDNDGLLDGDEINVYDTNASSSDTDGDCLLDSFEVLNYETNASNSDTDGDGRADGIEIYSYSLTEINSTCLSIPETLVGGHNTQPAMDNRPNDGTDVINALDPNLVIDSDGDGIVDSDERDIYGTNPESNDSDNDGLLDGDEINIYDTNASSSDTDGDCLLDSFEVLNYETNASNSDTDADGRADGIEIYSYSLTEINSTCLSIPETLVGGHNTQPAMDNRPNDGTDVINALDPNLVIDSDGDGIVDSDERDIYGTNPESNDSDNDGLLDGDEINIYDTNASSSDTDGDGLLDGEEINIYDTNVSNADTDGDGLLDGEEINIYDSNVSNADTDGDGLLDGEEINVYDSNLSNTDTDGDGLLDGQEVNIYDTNVSNADTDGDCLLDGFEILNYETNASNSDTDEDSVADGIEVYSYATNDLNVSCLTTPETLTGGANENPAKDGLPTPVSDVINALDLSNDSDGDGQSNSFENNCTQGDAVDATKACPYIFDSHVGQVLTSHGYSYVPGGFDVDGDGINEGGFWISRYQARASGIEISSQSVIEDVGNVNQYLSKKFKVLNRNVDVLSYNEAPLKETGVVAGSELIFDEESIAGIERISNFTPYLAEVCLDRYVLRDENGEALDINITMPSHKQYMHVKMLLDADLVTPNENGLLGDGRHIRNGVLGRDPNVPLFTYNLIIDEFGEDLKEFVRNLVQLRQTVNTNTFVDTFTFAEDVPDWWDANPSKFKAFDSGANTTQDLGNGIGPEKDSYAVIVRGGTILDVTQGISGALTDDAGLTNGISFRAATDYLY
ncbi:MAG: internalin, putative [uncultured Sulfurovum sp.]|uniref:Internalin, putative n=1 Tax=uncultured Sulfurovum sp. TaxID=269237 RepID=A0A6S6SZF6_9BACT|nr:MAG: internalin, putative [uncultured Sulfurovum sp.]